MLVLALDTATPAVTAGVVELTPDALVARSVRVVHDPRKHAELLMPGVLAACADAGIALREIDAVVVGTGPGPFTGLRVGMVTAAALGDALGVPVHGVCTLDAIAADATAATAPTATAPTAPGPAAPASDPTATDESASDAPVTGTLLVVTDARRREVYWAAYDVAGARVDGPHVESPAALVERGLAVAAAAGGSAAGLGWPVREPAAPSPRGLVAVAADAVRAGVDPGPLEPLYLRRPDAQEPGARKKVSAR